MKQRFLFLMLIFFCMTAGAQVRPKMNALFNQLKELGAAPLVKKTGAPNVPTRLMHHVNIYYSPDMYIGVESPILDSLLRERKNELDSQLATIRSTLDELQGEAQESYHYEYHRDGIDSISYSMNFSCDSMQTKKIQDGYRTYIESDESIYFNYEPVTTQMSGSYSGYLGYLTTMSKNDSSCEQYTIEKLTNDIDCLFRQHLIKSRKAMWRHDKDFSDSVSNATLSGTVWFNYACDFLSITNYPNHTSEGVTDCSIYTLPAEQDLLAELLLEKFDSLALEYTDNQNSYYYDYTYEPAFNNPQRNIVLVTYDHIKGVINPFADFYSLHLSLDEFGFHFGIFHTKGIEWIPRNWPSIKTYVNGKKTYFKGMRPEGNMVHR